LGVRIPPGTQLGAVVNFRFLHRRHYLPVLIAGGAILAMALIALPCRRDPQINFLPGDPRADWIVVPSSFEARAHVSVPMDATFRREFVLEQAPAAASLAIRAAKELALTINGQRISLQTQANWKNLSTFDILPLLRPGANEIEARVYNKNAPPALWLAITANGKELLRTDTRWQISCAGSSWHNAALASEPRQLGTLDRGLEQPVTALATIWPIWLLFVAAAILLLVGGHWWLTRTKNSKRCLLILLMAATILWLTMFLHNAPLLPFRIGFDQQGHANYIIYIQQHHAFPLPNEGFEMFQPPLYYALAAVLLSVFHWSVDEPSGVLLLRLLTTLLGVVDIILVYLTMRLLFPRDVGKQLVGTLFATFLPMQLYLSHFMTNETLAATLSLASLWFAIWLLIRGHVSPGKFGLLGLLVGLAMLTKATAVLLLPAVLMAVGLAQLRLPGTLARNIVAILTGCLAVCGWHYFRIWRHFGNPLIGNWDPATGFLWWQDPGYHVSIDYLRFGGVLLHPFFSGLAGLFDGIYSTFWGDALIAGVPSLDLRPPWNDKLMVGGYLLALIPTLLILTGAAVSVRKVLRNPTGASLLLLSFAGAMAVGLVSMTLRVASYAQIKAFYASSMLVALSCFMAEGWGCLVRRRKSLRIMVNLILLLFAINSYASYWVRPTAYQHVFAAMKWNVLQKADAADRETKKAAACADHTATTRRLLAFLFNALRQPAAAREQAERAVALDDGDAASHMQLGLVLAADDQLRGALEEGLRAIALAPDRAEFYATVTHWLLQAQSAEEAFATARDGLAVNPYNTELHYLLALAATGEQDYVTAANQFGYTVLLQNKGQEAQAGLHRSFVALLQGKAAQRIAELIRTIPDSPRELDELAWLLATYPEDAIRNGGQAVFLAERASRLTAYRDSSILATLAAAYAETGRFAEATARAEQALQLSRAANDRDMIVLSESLLETFRGKLPYRDKPPSL
jgi:4-amino-4-deoxy-L-arabinose transferase-like glycosyltransferase